MKRIELTLITIFILASPSISQIIHVPSDQPTIQAGIDSSSIGDTILVDDGTYLENINFRGKAITVASHFLLDGDTSHISRTIIDGSNPEHPDSASTVTMLLARDTTSVLCGFTIQGGTGTGPFEFVLGGNLEKQGGGIISAGGKITNNRIIHNHIDYQEVVAGGGLSIGMMHVLQNDTGVNLVVRDNMITGNTIHSELHYTGGGGMSVSFTNGITLIENNQIFENKSATDQPYKAMGGGLQLGRVTSNTGTAIIRNNHIHHNEAHSEESFGGGIFYLLLADEEPQEFHPFQFYNNIVESNYSQNYGGGMSIWYLGYWAFPPPVDPVLFNNTFVDNSAARGTGISVVDAKVLMFNNILWNDPIGERGEEIFTDLFRYCPGYSPQWCFNQNFARANVFYNDIQGGWDDTGNMEAVPVFDPETFKLTDGNPCIGAGIDSVEFEGNWHHASSCDYYGNVRPNPIDNKLDLGAIESPFKKDYATDIEQTFSERISLYPNPVHDVITIKTGQSGQHSIKIIFLNGQLILSKEFEGSAYHIDLSSFKKGVYLITIQSKEAVTTRKIVKF